MTTAKQRAYLRAYYQAHRERILAWHRKHLKKNHRKIMAYKKRYYQEHRAARLAYAADYRRVHTGGYYGLRQSAGGESVRPLDVGRSAPSEMR